MSYVYAESGQPTYCVGPRLQELFRETSVHSVPMEKLNLPYPCVYVALPECEHVLWGGRTSWHNIDGVYVTRKGGTFAFVMWAGANRLSVDFTDDASFWVAVEGEKLPRGSDPGTKNLEHGLEHVFVDVRGDVSDVGMDMPADDAGRDKVTSNIRDVCRICFNLLQYLHSSGAETEELPTMDGEKVRALRKQARRRGKKGDKARKKLANHTEAKLVWIGKSIEQRWENAAPRRPSLLGRAGRNVTPHWRKGHFHHYWVGP
ncbi:MAG: hypothetical protein ACYTFG_16335, partial [Planctomycetota bacterium]